MGARVGAVRCGVGGWRAPGRWPAELGEALVLPFAQAREGAGEAGEFAQSVMGLVDGSHCE